jgi:thiol-disulfide isomerase/thioredoxin
MIRSAIAFLILGLAGSACAGMRVIEFSASWCEPCRDMEPIVASLQRQGYPIETRDFDDERQLATHLGVKEIPAFVAISPDGTVREVVQGKISEDKLRALFWWPVDERRDYHRAVARVIDRGHFGSGVLINEAGRLVLLTASHVVSRSISDGKPFIATADGKSYRCRVIHSSPPGVWDVALCATEQVYPDAVTARIRPGQIVRPPDVLECAGYGNTESVLSSVSGRMTQYVAPPGYRYDLLELAAVVRDGDSGGPIFDARGDVVGIISGSNPRTRVTVGTQYMRIGLMLDACDKSQFAVISRTVALKSACDKAKTIVSPPPLFQPIRVLPEPIDDSPGRWPPPPAPSPPAPEPEKRVVSIELVPLVEENARQIATLTENHKLLAEAVRDCVSTPGPQGEIGPQGEQGEQGDSATVDIDAIVTEVLKSLPSDPLFYAIHRDPETGAIIPQTDPATGQVYEIQPINRGDDWTIYLHSANKQGASK